MKKVLVIFRSGPYGSARARAGLDAALAALAFDHPLSVLFAGDGVFAVTRGHDGGAAGLKSTAAGFRALPHHGAERVGVVAADLAARGLDSADLVVGADSLDAATARQWLVDSDVVLAF